GIGTDSKAINAALRECKSQEDIDNLKKEYAAAHGGRSLDEDIKDPQSKALMSPEDPEARQTAAVLALKDARSFLGSTDPEKVHAALEKLSPEERKAAMDKYKEETGSSLQDASKTTAVAAGAAKGALIGSIIPGVGTVLGGLVGGVVGALSGSESADEDNKAIDKVVQGDEAGYRKDVIEKELHGGLFGSGGVLGLGIGRDTDKIDRAIETAKPEDVKKLKEAVGKDITQTLSGDDEKLATALLDGDKGKAAAEAVRIHQSDDIFSHDKEKVFAQMEGKSPAEREAMKAEFQHQYGMSADEFMEKEFGKDSDELKAARQLENSKDKKAKMDPAFELKYAMDGAGTDMKRFKDALAGKSPDDIAKIKDDYLKLTGKTLEEDMAGESKLHSTSLITGEVSESRDGLEIKQMLRGDPERIKDPVERAKAKLLNSNED